MIPVRFRAAFVLAMALLSTLPAPSLADDPVTATSSSSDSSLAVGERTEVVLSVHVESGWHINSHDPGAEFLIPTTLEFDVPAGISVRVDYPEPVLRRLSFAGGRELKVYEGAFAIRATLSYDAVSAPPAALSALLRYQACNDSVCKRPALLRIPIDVKIASADSLTSRSDIAEGLELPWQPFSTNTYDAARQRRAPFVIEFRADWCAPCREMGRRTFRDPGVVKAGEGVSFLSVDMTEPDDFIERVLRSFRITAAPTTIFFDSKGKEWRRQGGFIGPEEFAQLLRDVRKDAKPGPRDSGGVKPI